MSTERVKNVTSFFVINLLNNKTIILSAKLSRSASILVRSLTSQMLREW